MRRWSPVAWALEDPSLEWGRTDRHGQNLATACELRFACCQCPGGSQAQQAPLRARPYLTEAVVTSQPSSKWW